MAHAQKPYFVFRRNGRVHISRRLASVQSTTGSRGVRISGSNAGYTMFRGSVKGTGFPLHSPVSPSLTLPCVTVCHHISTGVYHSCLCACLERNGTAFTLLILMCLNTNTTWCDAIAHRIISAPYNEGLRPGCTALTWH